MIEQRAPPGVFRSNTAQATTSSRRTNRSSGRGGLGENRRRHEAESKIREAGARIPQGKCYTFFSRARALYHMSLFFKRFCIRYYCD